MKYVKLEVFNLLEQLRVGQKITVCYFGKNKKDYLIYTGRVSQINNHSQYLCFDKLTVPYTSIDIIAIP